MRQVTGELNMDLTYDPKKVSEWLSKPPDPKVLATFSPTEKASALANQEINVLTGTQTEDFILTGSILTFILWTRIAEIKIEDLDIENLTKLVLEYTGE
jgi:hypothetical protein